MVMVDQEAPGMDVSRTAILNSRTRKVLKRDIVQIISQNVRGLKTVDRINELTLLLYKRNIFMACVQETWRTGFESLNGNFGYKLLLSGKERQTSNRGSSGIGIVLSPKSIFAWEAAGSEVHCISARVMAVRLSMVDSQKRISDSLLFPLMHL